MFGKDKKTFEDEEEEDHKELPRGPRPKDFKNLDPLNQKKRKESKKPWGKKERIFVLSVILFTAGTSLFLALSSYSWNAPFFPRISFPTFSFPKFGEEVIVVESKRKETEEKEKIISIFKEKTQKLAGAYGLYVVDLESGYSFGVNEKESFQAASLIKLPVMVASFLEEKKGSMDLDAKYRLKDSDKVKGAGSLYTKPEGYEITFRDLIRLMGKQSDNTAFNILRKTLDDEKIEKTIEEIGMLNTSLKDNKTTPEDIGIFFENLWRGNILDASSRDEILEYLTDTIYEDWLAAGIPQGVRVAHKYGREVHVVNDAGIVFAKEPFVLVILSKGVIEREADNIFPEISSLIFEIKARD